MADAASDPTTSKFSHDVGMGTFVLALALGIVARACLSSLVRLPYTCLVLIFGLLYGFLIYTEVGITGSDIFSRSADLWINISPEAILTVILPILIFGSSFASDLHLFLQQLTPVLTLAGPAVLVNAALLGLTAKYVLPYNWDWMTSLMVGSMLSATDPVAVVAILKELGVVESLSILIDGESLLNDGFAIVLYTIFSRLVVHEETLSVLETVESAVILCLGGPAIGLVVGALTSYILGVLLNDPASEITMTILCGYGAYLLAELAEASGVLSMVVAGLYLSFHGLGRISARVTGSLKSFWAMAAFISETIIFFVSGLIMAEKALISETVQGRDWGYLFLLYLIVNATRFVGVFLFFPTLARGPYGINWRQAVLLSWGGLRGAVSLTLALVVSQEEGIPEETRALILFFTAGIVLLTILINGSTCKLVLQKLKLNNPTRVEQELYIRAMNLIENELEVSLLKLKNDKYLGNADWNVVYRYLPVFSPQIYWHRVREGHICLDEAEIALVGRYVREEEEEKEGGEEGGWKEGRKRSHSLMGPTMVGSGPGKLLGPLFSCCGGSREGGGGGGSKYEELPPRLRHRWREYTTRFNGKLKSGIDGERLSGIRKQVWESLALARGVFPPATPSALPPPPPPSHPHAFGLLPLPSWVHGEEKGEKGGRDGKAKEGREQGGKGVRGREGKRRLALPTCHARHGERGGEGRAEGGREGRRRRRERAARPRAPGLSAPRLQAPPLPR
ncbi:salt overly sensitive 1 [Nannochloropsis gaditana]|uniref:Salt overly sensitive 1 n=1 Tax=Nannochloropsis gaditana TaxID=72520 RepID=W7T4P8_9STRA|nr:salt overly sensitive 1 [Nannochloropsis gaditana]